MAAGRIQEDFFLRSQPTPASETPGAVNAWMSSLEDWQEKLEQAIADHPGASLGAALAVGLLIGWWTKRS